MNDLQEKLMKAIDVGKHVHIALAGGQAAPIYNGIVATNPNMVEVIYSEQSANVVERIRQEITVPIIDSSPLSPTNPDKIIKRAKELAEKYKDYEITVNISSGPKSWSHLFGMVFQNLENASVVYMDQNNVLWNYRTMKAQRGFEFDMYALFRLYGNNLTRFTPFSSYTEKDKVVCKTIEELRKLFPQEFNSLFLATSKEIKNKITAKKGCYNNMESYVEWDRTACQEGGNCKINVFLKSKKRDRELTFSSPHAHELLFNAGWFEYKVAEVFSHWDKAKEVLLNCKFPAKNNADKNEVDIIVNAGTKIIFVECKTQITSTTDIDKFRSVVKNYGGMGSKGIFVTDAEKTDLAKEKCQQNGIIDIDLTNDFDEKKFFKLLDKELGQLNTK